MHSTTIEVCQKRQAGIGHKNQQPPDLSRVWNLSQTPLSGAIVAEVLNLKGTFRPKQCVRFGSLLHSLGSSCSSFNRFLLLVHKWLGEKWRTTIIAQVQTKGCRISDCLISTPSRKLHTPSQTSSLVCQTQKHMQATFQTSRHAYQ